MKWLPKGKTEDGKGFRDRDLVQLYTDPGGIRTLALAQITFGKKRKKRTTTSDTPSSQLTDGESE